MPTYYIMDFDKAVAATVSEYQPSSAYVAACKWMTEADVHTKLESAVVNYYDS